MSKKTSDKVLAKGQDGGRTVGRVLALLELMAGSRVPLRLTDIARTLDLPASSAHALLQQLIKYDYVKLSADSDRLYERGAELALLSSKSNANLDLVRTARPILRELSAQVGENTFLGMCHSRGVSYVDSVEDIYGLTMRFPMGTLRPLHASSTGKLFLAMYSTSDTLKTYLGAEPLAAFTRNTMTDLVVLSEQLGEIRQTGLALNREEVVEGACGISAPIFDANQRFVGCLTVGVPQVRFEARQAIIKKNILVGVQKISRRLGNPDWEGTLALLRDNPEVVLEQP
ncbi:IclR family transcriptional regulator [Szabonella alba]|uniref:IclR family transcriptional regulator n=1 Tax=Szabonella alba TaxID=2804194 RepID=A0A8K0VDR4_9RHOB|nr:IclR family transcriptional regulator [Szabonella alba]MBL4919236.1 IclR family transcriptional regulator [Szabonella alba]